MAEIKTPLDVYTRGGEEYAVIRPEHTVNDILRYALAQEGGGKEALKALVDFMDPE